MLYSLALERKAPAIFARVTRSGTPVWALLATAAVAGLCLLSFLFSPGKLYLWLLNTSGMLGFIAWLGIAISHYRFRRGYLFHGNDLAKLPYVSKYFPFGPLFAFGLCMVVMLGQNYQAFIGGQIDWIGAFATYVGLVLFVVVWLGRKLVTGSRVVRYREMDFSYIETRKAQHSNAEPCVEAVAASQQPA